jgi:sugar transferase (PEP-CTERM system associated)
VLLRYLTFHKLGAVLIENALLMTCALFDTISNDPVSSDLHSYATSLGRGFIFAAAFQVGLHLRDAYDFGLQSSLGHIAIRFIEAIALACLAISTLYFAIPGLSVGADSLAILFLRAAAVLAVWHALLRLYFRHFTRRAQVLIVGTGRLARALAREVLQCPEKGFAVCGFLDDDPSLLGVSIVNPKVIGLNTDLKRIVAEQKVKKIVVELQDRRGRLPIGELLDLKAKGVSIEEATSLYERMTGKIAVENLKASWMVFSDGFVVSRGKALLTQSMSFSVSLMLSILFIPALPLIALLIKLDSRGPVFFGQERVGQQGKVFTLWKFRSMRDDAERFSGPVWAKSADDRVTRVGKYLRRSRLDELPQLFNILKGDMNLVGPRPERPHFVRELSEIIPFYHLRHAVKPGVTGWAQIKYRYGNSVDDSIEKLQYDLFYIKNLSVLLDAFVILDTVKTVLVRKGS